MAVQKQEKEENKESTKEKQKSASEQPQSSENRTISQKIVLLTSFINLIVTVGLLAFVFSVIQKEKHKPSIEDIVLNSNESSDPKDSEQKKSGKKSEETDKKKESNIKMISLDQFTINLASTPGTNPKFIRASISIEVLSEEIEAEIHSRIPQIRNIIIDIFNSKKVSDLSNTSGREYLKEEIINSINAVMISGKVKGVYFTNFALAG
jgi:flagellar basal body-associated protein FliL